MVQKKIGAWCFFRAGTDVPILVVLTTSRKKALKAAEETFGGKVTTYKRPPFIAIDGYPQLDGTIRAFKARELVQ